MALKPIGNGVNVTLDCDHHRCHLPPYIGGLCLRHSEGMVDWRGLDPVLQQRSGLWVLSADALMHASVHWRRDVEPGAWFGDGCGCPLSLASLAAGNVSQEQAKHPEYDPRDWSRRLCGVAWTDHFAVTWDTYPFSFSSMSRGRMAACGLARALWLLSDREPTAVPEKLLQHAARVLHTAGFNADNPVLPEFVCV